MTAEFRTARGIYRLTMVSPAAISDSAAVLTLALESASGIERVAFRCRIAASVLEPTDDISAKRLFERIVPWVEHDFEQTREAALKSIRADRKVLEVVFDRDNPGPF